MGLWGHIIRFVFLQIGILALAVAVIFGIGYGIDEIGLEMAMLKKGQRKKNLVGALSHAEQFHALAA